MKFGPYTEHPVAALFPLMRDTDEDGYSALIHGIRDDGLIEPIVLDDDMIIDGRNRYLACIEAKVEPKFVQYADMGMDMPTFEFAFQRNYVRRQMTPDQRAAVLAGYLAFDEDSVKQQRIVGGKQGGKLGGRGHKKTLPPDSREGFGSHKKATHTVERVAKGAKVSAHKAQQAINVQTRGSDELKTAVRNGKTTLAQAQVELTPRVVVSDAGARVGLEDLLPNAPATKRDAGKSRRDSKYSETALRKLLAPLGEWRAAPALMRERLSAELRALVAELERSPEHA